MKKLVRNLSTPESREFWAGIERSSAEVQQWPSWKRAGINESQLRRSPAADDSMVSTDPEGDE